MAEKEIHELIDQLPKGYGRVFRMSVIEGYSHQEIAEKLGIEPHSSSSQLSRAKALLRKMINRRGMGIVILVLVCTPLGIYLLKDRGKEEIQKINIASEKKNIIRQVENKAPNNAANVASANSVAEIRCNQYGVSSIIPEEIPSNDWLFLPICSMLPARCSSVPLMRLSIMVRINISPFLAMMKLPTSKT